MGIKYDASEVRNAKEYQPRGPKAPKMVLEQETGSAHDKDWEPIRGDTECENCGKKGRCKVGPKGLRGYCHREQKYFPILGATPRMVRAEAGPGYMLPKKPKPQKSVIPDDVLDLAYTMLLDMCPLSPAHLENLLARGYTEEEARTTKGSLLPNDNAEYKRRVAIRKAIEAQVGRRDIPIVKDLEKNFTPSGILCRFRNAVGMTVFMQVREDFGKYKGGLGSRGRAHVVHGNLLDLVPGLNDNRVWITEGPIKGELASKWLKARVITVPGVDTAHEDVVSSILQVGATQAVVAYDADLATNKDVLRARNAMASRLYAAGIKVEVAGWDEAYGKGIDDLIANGHRDKISVNPWTPVAKTGAAAKALSEADPIKKGLQARSRATQRDAVAILLAAGDKKGAERLRRAAYCGIPIDTSSCLACEKPVGVVALAAESPYCPHCSRVLLVMIPVALESEWPEELVCGSIELEDQSPGACRKAQAAIQKKLKKADKAASKRVRYIRGPGRVGVLGANLSDVAALVAADVPARRVTRATAIELTMSILRRRYHHLQKLTLSGNAQALADDEWGKRFVATTAGDDGVKQLPWPGTKKIRKLYRQAQGKDDDGGGMNALTECCGAVKKHSLSHGETGALISIRIKKPFVFRESYKKILVYETESAAGTWKPPMSIAERAAQAPAPSG